MTSIFVYVIKYVRKLLHSISYGMCATVTLIIIIIIIILKEMKFKF